MDFAAIAEQIRRELGKRPEQLFASFEPEAFAAASLGQVHRARLKSGEEVAVKIQYPGVEDTVEQDLKNIKLLLQARSRRIARDLMRQKIDTRALYSELAGAAARGTRLRQRGAQHDEFGKLLGDDEEIMIPRVDPELSSRRVLTMTYIDGYQLTDVLSPAADAELREWVARKYYKLVWRQILEFGVLHTDPHPGNYLVSYHPRLGILDFGSVRRFPEPMRQAHLQFARALLAGDDRSIAGALVKLGYLDRTDDPAPMVKIIHILFEPVIVDRVFNPTGIRFGRQGDRGRRDRLQAQALQVAGAQCLPVARAGRARRDYPRARDSGQLLRDVSRMRRARPGLSPIRLGLEAVAALERHRDFHFRRTKARRVTGEQSALRFINEVGFCAAFTAGLGVPCLREAIAGEREPAVPGAYPARLRDRDDLADQGQPAR